MIKCGYIQSPLEKQKDKTNFLSGFLLGALIGSAMAIIVYYVH